jgi:hypothetical protein
MYTVWRFSAVAEQAIARQNPSLPVPTQLEAVVVPEDLVAIAMIHSEVWAQEDTLKAIRERYEQLQDWNRVRSAFGIGSMA